MFFFQTSLTFIVLCLSPLVNSLTVSEIFCLSGVRTSSNISAPFVLHRNILQSEFLQSPHDRRLVTRFSYPIPPQEDCNFKVRPDCYSGDSLETTESMALCLGQVFSKDKTFRPKKRFEPGTQRFELYKKAQASLKSGLDLRKVVQLPDGESLNDWIAVHVVDFFNRINLIYGTMSEYCTERTCPIMSGGLKYEYRWRDGEDYRKPTKLPALKYMNLLMDWIESLINDEDIFPTRVGVCEEPTSGGAWSGWGCNVRNLLLLVVCLWCQGSVLLH